jgi:NADH dehydrogenase
MKMKLLKKESKSKRQRGLWIAAGLTAGALGAGLLLRQMRARARGGRGAGETGPSVVILGAGFAGLAAARAVQRRLNRPARLLLIDQQNYHLFTPMLYQVATWALDPYAIAFPVRRYAGRHGLSFRRATVTGLDLAGRRVLLGDEAVSYDYLLIALGSTTNFYGNDSAREHAFPLKRLEDGIAIRGHIIDMLEQAVLTEDAAERWPLLTFVIVGGGATGVESAAALADFVRRVLPADYPSLDPAEAHVVLLETTDQLLAEMGEHFSSIALRDLRDMGVDVRLKTTAKQVQPWLIQTDDGQQLSAHTIIWAAGVRAPELVAGLPGPHAKDGRLKVDECLRVQGLPNVYAAGDSASFINPASGQPLPLLAQVAEQAGQAAGENIARAVSGEAPRPFHFHWRGNAVALGRSQGILEMAGRVVDGWLGWLAWRAIHLAKIAGLRDKALVLLDWSAGYLYDLDTARLAVEPDQGNPAEAQPIPENSQA